MVRGARVISRYRTRLLADLERWQARGWVNAEGAGHIRKDVAEASGGASRIPGLLASIGVICLALAVAAFVAVDSPAANFPICKIAKRRGIRVVHLVAPQVWAWGKWRVKKLRKLTDMVLCLLPFEEKWFEGKGVPAKYVGHPLFDIPLDHAALEAAAAKMPEGSPKIALLPGSRPKEHVNNFPLLLESFRRLKADRPETVGVVAATKPEVAESLRETARSLGGWPDGLSMEIRSTDAVVKWCDLALVVAVLPLPRLVLLLVLLHHQLQLRLGVDD